MNIAEQIIELEGISIPDLIKGEKGDKGERGEKGEQGERGEKGETPDLTGYATETYVDEAIKNVEADVDLTGYATEAWVEGKGYLTEHQSLNGYATETYVNDAVKNAKIDVDLTGYATEKWVEGKGYLTTHQDISQLATKTEVSAVEGKIPTAVSELTNDANYITIEAVDNTIADIDFVKSGDLATVATSGSYLDLTNLPSSVGNWVYTEDFTDTHIADATALIVAIIANNAIQEALIMLPQGAKMSDGNSWYFTYGGSSSSTTVKSTYVKWNGTSLYCGQTLKYVYYATNVDIGTIVDFSAYAKTEDIPTKTSQLTNDSGFLTQHQSLAGFATEEWVGKQGYLTEHQDLSAYAKSADLATVATSGSYNDLKDTPTIPSTTGLATETYVDTKVAAVKVPTKTSELTNDSEYITIAAVDETIADIDFVKSGDLAAVATSGSYNDLIDKPSIAGSETQVKGVLKAGEVILTLEDAAFTENSTILLFTDIYNVYPKKVMLETGKLTLTFGTIYEVDVNVKAEVR